MNPMFPIRMRVFDLENTIFYFDTQVSDLCVQNLGTWLWTLIEISFRKYMQVRFGRNDLPQ
jgi:hypothetical protein